MGGINIPIIQPQFDTRRVWFNLKNHVNLIRRVFGKPINLV